MENHSDNSHNWQASGRRTWSSWQLFLLCALLVAIVLPIYLQVANFDFIKYDDDSYIINNPIVNHGMTREAIIKAFSSTHAANWHPLTWISHMLDVQFFGMNPGMHHLVNVFFHILNTILLFLVFHLMTGKIWRSFILATLFAVHPVHVESVAWISERKDVLSTFFWLITMIAYWWYVKKKSFSRYLLTAAAFLLGILSKPMVVTLPIVLLLMDYWPLNRFGEVMHRKEGNSSNTHSSKNSHSMWSALFSLIIEKIPLFIMSATSCAVTFYAQHNALAVATLQHIDPVLRIKNAVISYIVYLEKAILPINLSIFYPYSYDIPLHWVILCGLLTALITVFSFMKRRAVPYFVMGWMWYVITLIPVIGIVQVGSQASADRYTYIPLIGIFIFVIWGLVDFFSTRKFAKTLLPIVSIVVIGVLMRLSWVQIGYWKDTESLFRHAMAVTPENYVAHFQVGVALDDKGNSTEAMKEYFESLRINPTFYLGYHNLGRIFLNRGHYDQALYYYSKALALNPNLTLANWFIGTIYSRKGNLPKAIEYYNKCLLENPRDQKIIQALENAKRALMREENEISEIKRGMRENPQGPSLPLKLAEIYKKRDDFEKAIVLYQQALSINPHLKVALNGLVSIYSTQKDYENAVKMLQRIRAFEPDNAYVYYDIGCIYSLANKPDDAIFWLKQAVSRGFHNADLIRKDPSLLNLRLTPSGEQFLKQMVLDAAEKSGEDG